MPVALSITLLASACGLSDESSDAAIDSVRIANTVEVPSGTKLVVAEQNGTQSLPWNLANAGKDAPYSVEFADFSGGAAVIEALRSGAADVGSIGEAPVPIAVDSGVTDLVTIGLQANPGTSGGYFLVARPGSGITSIEQLRGKRVAYPPGSGRQMITAATAQAARPRSQDRRAAGRTCWGRGGSDIRGRCRRGGNRARQSVLPVGRTTDPRRRQGNQHRYPDLDRAQRHPRRSGEGRGDRRLRRPRDRGQQLEGQPRRSVDQRLLRRSAGHHIRSGQEAVRRRRSRAVLPDRRAVDRAVPRGRRRACSTPG